MSVPVLAESPTADSTSLCAALAQATGCPAQMWRRADERLWFLWPADSAQDGSSAAGDERAPRRLAGLLEQVWAMQSVWRAAEADGEIIAVPLRFEGDCTAAATISHVPPERAADVERIAALTWQIGRQEFEARSLREENLAFVQQVTDDLEELTFLRSIAADLVISDASMDVGGIVRQTIDNLRLMIGAKGVYYLRADDAGGLLLADSSQNEEVATHCWSDDVIIRTAEAARRRALVEPYICNNLANAFSEAYGAGVRQLLVVPICTSQRGFGWFVAVNRTLAGHAWTPSPLLQLGNEEFGTWEASLLNTAASLIASQASNLDLLREKERLLMNTVRSLVSALDAKDAYTRGHSERVALFSQRIAVALGYTAAAAERLYLAGLLHDVGKIGVCDATLRKPERLTAEEFAEMTQHPDEGWAILRDLPQLEYVLPAVLHHHEQFDGRGYPDGLAGEEIPLDARIMSVADAFDAMTSDRAYRSGMPTKTALEILRRGAGGHWDPRVVDAFLNVLDDILTIRDSYQLITRTARSEPALAPNCQA